jgi:sugar-specific transcriptional regulator TrmB
MSNIEDDIELLGLTLTSSDMQVLEALLNAHTSKNKYLTCDGLNEYIMKENKKEISSAWIYQCLNNLEKKGFIQIDIMSKPRRYMASQETVRSGLETALEERLAYYSKEREAVKFQIRKFKTLDIAKETTSLWDILLDRTEQQEEIILETTEEVRSVIINEIIKKGKKGDIIRIIQSPTILKDISQSTGPVENQLIAFVELEGEIRAILLMADLEHEMKMLVTFFRDMTEKFVNAISSTKMNLRYTMDKKRTYRFLALNDELMVLMLTDSVFPDKAVLLRREDNPKLFDDAISTFEMLYRDAEDFNTLLYEFSQKQKN